MIGRLRLDRLASLIRSKNAGPFQLTFDIVFSDPALYEEVKSSHVLNGALIARLYDCDGDSVQFFEWTTSSRSRPRFRCAASRATSVTLICTVGSSMPL